MHFMSKNEEKKLILSLLISRKIKLIPRHQYATHVNTRIVTDQVQQEQTIIREDIDSTKGKVDPIMETMLALAIRKNEICNVAATRNDVLVQWSTSHSRHAVPAPNPMIYDLPP